MELQTKTANALIETLLIAGLLLSLSACHKAAQNPLAPKILFTQVPQRDSGDVNQGDVMEGTVTGARPEQKMVLYSRTGGLWWLQPGVNAPLTPILPHGVWRNEMHLATDYAALLVDAGYHPAAVLSDLPKPGSGVDTVAITPGQDRSSSYFVNFSGLRWRVRKVPSARGGVSNPYNPGNVYVDPAGRLHLQVVNRNNQWTCSELNVTRSLGYGTYVLTVEDTSHLDPAAFFAIYTWDHSSNQGNFGEFDVNISRWGDPHHKNAQFVVQPAAVAQNISQFEAPAGKMQYTMIWEEGRVTMLASRVVGNESHLVAKHIFTNGIPRPVDESLRMALYAYSDPNHKLPAIERNAEVIVDHLDYLP